MFVMAKLYNVYESLSGVLYADCTIHDTVYMAYQNAAGHWVITGTREDGDRHVEMLLATGQWDRDYRRERTYLENRYGRVFIRVMSWTDTQTATLHAHLTDYLNPRHGIMMSREYDHAIRIARALDYLKRRAARNTRKER